jgi:hypothetical protein
MCSFRRSLGESKEILNEIGNVLSEIGLRLLSEIGLNVLGLPGHI